MDAASFGQGRLSVACPAILTGDQFLVRVLGAIDCQAQLIGSYGWQALGEPGSLAATVMAGLLTIFFALFGIRLLFGPAPGARDVVGDVIKIGIVLTLAFSWPAFRTVVHDVVLKGPAEISGAVTSPINASEGASFAQRLQKVDTAMVQLTAQGMGRNTGAFADSDDSFRGSALEDESTLGFARLAYLSGVIGSLALLRFVAAMLLALAPLAAGLLLFEQTRGLFSGWLRGLVLALIGSVGVSVLLTAQLGILGPWLTDALRLRSLGYATPSAPIELLAITLGFAIAQFAIVWVLAKVAFTRGWIVLPTLSRLDEWNSNQTPLRSDPAPVLIEGRTRRIVDSVEAQMRREEMRLVERFDSKALSGTSASSEARSATLRAQPERLGTSWKRTSSRPSIAAKRRDGLA